MSSPSDPPRSPVAGDKRPRDETPEKAEKAQKPEPAAWLLSSYDEREAVKALGGQWDPDKRQWFVPAGMDTTAFAQWLPGSAKFTYLACPYSEREEAKAKSVRGARY